eukprot:CFRG8523T1
MTMQSIKCATVLRRGGCSISRSVTTHSALSNNHQFKGQISKDLVNSPIASTSFSNMSGHTRTLGSLYVRTYTMDTQRTSKSSTGNTDTSSDEPSMRTKGDTLKSVKPSSVRKTKAVGGKGVKNVPLPLRLLPRRKPVLDQVYLGPRGELLSEEHIEDIKRALEVNKRARKNEYGDGATRCVVGDAEWKKTMRKVIDGQGVKTFADDKKLQKARVSFLTKMSEKDISEAFSQRFDRAVTLFIKNSGVKLFKPSNLDSTADTFVENYLLQKSRFEQKERDTGWTELIEELNSHEDEIARMDVLNNSKLFEKASVEAKIDFLNETDLIMSTDEESLNDQLKLVRAAAKRMGVTKDEKSSTWFGSRATQREQIMFVRQLLGDRKKMVDWCGVAPAADQVKSLVRGLAVEPHSVNKSCLFDSSWETERKWLTGVV